MSFPITPQYFLYTDASGSFPFTKETKKIDNKIVTRNIMRSEALKTKQPQQSSNLLIEKSVLLSKLGSVKTSKGRLLVLRPERSEYTVWLEGKKYQNVMTIDPVEKKMKVSLLSAPGVSEKNYEEDFPKSSHICFFNQLPECLKASQLLQKLVTNKSFNDNIFIAWDNYPFVKEMYLNVGAKLFSPATVKYEGLYKNDHRIVIEVEGQVLVYFFNKKLDFKKLAWIAQGLTLAPPDESFDE